MPTRTATATWEGGIKDGKGKFEAASGLHAAYGFNTRFGDEPGSNPEELLAAAHAACFSMALSLGLEMAGKKATKIETKGACTVDKVGDGFEITKMKLTTRVTAPGLDAETFQKIAQQTKEQCPVSKALHAVKSIELDAQLA